MSKFLIGLIKFYRKCISPLKLPCCRFTPTCSQYAIEAITIHGAFKGTMLAIWRVLRCNPFCKGGFDPVPEKRK
ncbi:MAG: membrane protein insertion efficiency factor YidD [Clostridia bacterium]|nr:membrane protein insertion efficiency factor YidD [Clostridia bacterium]